MDAPAQPLTSPSEARRTRLKRFSRDVIVNVVANLIAAAVIYLLAAMAGLTPRSPELVVTAVSVVASGVGIVLSLAVIVVRGRRMFYVLSSGTVLSGLGVAIGPFTGDGVRSGLDIGVMVAGLLMASFGVVWLISTWRESRTDSC